MKNPLKPPVLCLVLSTALLVAAEKAEAATQNLTTKNNERAAGSHVSVQRRARCFSNVSFFQFIRDIWHSERAWLNCRPEEEPTSPPTISPSAAPTESPSRNPTIAPTTTLGSSDGSPGSEPSPGTGPFPSTPEPGGLESTPGPTTQSPVNSQFSIDLELDLQGIGDPSVFDAAVAKWESIITGDLPDFNGNLGGTSECGAWPTFIDDVFICGKYSNIDGPGMILGQAGPRAYRPSSGLPITGEMYFDAADIVAGTIQDLLGVIIHEMGHVLGLGSLWVINGLTNSYTAPCPYVYDSAASQEFRAISGCSTAIPVEMDTGRAGSDCGHWAENCLGSEVMTSAAGSLLTFSRITIGGLADLGYEVNYDAADDFTSFDMNSACLCNNRVRRKAQEGHEGIHNIGGHDRQLSKEGHMAAMDYGRQVLSRNREQLPLIPSSDAIDIGGDIVFIMYIEEGKIYSIMVTAED